jgi:K+-sensing histidine kinase KdpD
LVEMNAVEIEWEGRYADLDFLTDVTERKIAEGALLITNRKLNLPSSITRHDINNQMTAIMGNIELLERKHDDAWSKNHFLQVKTSAERISAIIKFTKTYAEIGVKAPIWNDVRKLVGASARDIRIGDVKLVNDIPTGLEVYADPLIMNVFSNLIDNAVRHSGKLDTVRFYIEKHEGNQAIVCEDNGVGISNDVKKKLFTQSSEKSHGMFLSKEILAITGITISEVGEPGHGAKFVMTIHPNGTRGMS